MTLRALPILLALACADTTPDADLGPTGGTGGDDTAPTDVPVVDGSNLPNALVPDVDLLPWPADVHLAPDDRTRTGLRVAVPDDSLPDGMSAGMFARDDGFSRVPPIVTWWPGGIDASTLPDPSDWAATTDASSPVLLVNAATGALVPALVEPDATAEPDEASLLVRAHRTLAPGTRHVVIVTDAVKRLDGTPAPRMPHLDALLAGEPTGNRAVDAWLAPFVDVRTVLGDLGLDPARVAHAWSFTTRSAAGVTADAVAMQDVAATVDASGFTLEAPSEDAGCAPDCVVVYGTLDVPWFLGDDDQIVYGDDGLPQVQQTRAVPILVTLPKTITGPRPVVLFGHGFFSAIEEPTWSNLFDGLEQWQMAAVTTKFFGFAEEDLLQSAAALGNDLSGLKSVIDQQLQSQANFTVLHRALTGPLAAALTVDLGEGDVQPLDATNVPYMGISNGGTQGLVLMTTSPTLTRGALVVPGGGWAHMLQRASQWNELGAVFSGRYRDKRELQIAMALLQQVFDPVDSLNYVEHLVDDRLPGRPAEPDILMVESVGDAQVANMVSRWAGGTAGVALLTPSVADVWGMPTVAVDDLPTSVGYEIYDLGADPLPPGNVAPTENGVHDDVRRRDDYRAQMGRFLETGEIVRTCDGLCGPVE